MKYIPYQKSNNRCVYVKGKISYFSPNRMSLFYNGTYSFTDPEIENQIFTRKTHNKISCRFVSIIKETSEFLYCENLGKSKSSQPFICFEKRTLLIESK